LIAYAQDDLDQARRYFLEAIDLFEELGDRGNIASARINLARTIYRQGDHAQAVQQINESLSISRELNLSWTLSLGLEISGLIQRSLHNDQAALALFLESLEMSIDQDNRQGIANCLGAIAGLAAIANQAVASVVLFAAAQKIRQEIGAGMGSGDQAEYDYHLTLARRQLAEDKFNAAWNRGSNLTLDQVVELTQIQPPSRILSIINRIEVLHES
jgi:tetratricopeptide (TPR) repeat protein